MLQRRAADSSVAAHDAPRDEVFGFAPLRLPEDLDFMALFHGVDERVPVDSLEFGARVFDRFLGML